MPILCLEGASGVGKSTTCQEIAKRYNAYVVQEVNDLFKRPDPMPEYWYFERQMERWQIAQDKLKKHEIVLLDGDVFQPLWYNRAYDFKVFEQCADLYVSVFNNEPWYDEWTVETASTRLKDIHNTPNSLGYVYLNEEGLIGFAFGYSEQWFNGVHFNLVELCVTTSLQRKGNGTKLLQYLETELKQKNITYIYLITSKGDIAESFYRKNDYNTNQDMTIMEKRFL